ncbi:MAG: protein kinase [Elusimicrobia bacterium]|nr:protein kinase [Elusimicrobiota bacterium]
MRLAGALSSVFVGLSCASAWAQAPAPVSGFYPDAAQAKQALESQLQASNLPSNMARMSQVLVDTYYRRGAKPGLSDQDLQSIVAYYKDRHERMDYLRQARADGLSDKERAVLEELAAKEKAVVEGMNPKLKEVVQTSAYWRGGRGYGGGGGNLLQRVFDKWRAGNSQDALADLDEILQQDPGNVEARVAQATILADQGKMAQANAAARKALELDPNNKNAFDVYKLTEDRDGMPKRIDIPVPMEDRQDEPALASLRGPAWAQNSRNLGAQSALKAARERLAVGDRQAALAQIERALAADPRSLDALRLRAQTYARLGMHDAVLGAADKGLALHPRDVGLLNFKAFAKNKLKDYRGALELASQALELDPENADALANLAYAYGGLGDQEKMLSLLERASRLNPAYRASLESAQNRTAGDDVPFFYPWEIPAGAADRPAGPGRGGARRSRRFGILVLATLVGGFLVALGLLHSVALPLAARIKTALTRRAPAVAAREPEVAAALGEAPPRAAGDDGLLRGQYRVLRQIGAGGMGMVYEGADVTLDRKVAIKKMREELRLDRRERARFINEARLVASLHHPNIVDIYAIVEQGDEIFLVFEYVGGKTVHELIGGGRLAFRDALGVCRGMTAALEFAHGRGVVHRDLKPSNVMVSQEGFVKVMDFGIARLAKDTAMRFSVTNTVAGTPPYMAPEQEQGVVRREGDVYSLAVCVYEMLCGKAPFSGTGAGMLMNKVNMAYIPPSKLAPGLPAAADGVFARALQPDPSRRFATARELLAALETLA